jgi:hypothetical protein
MATRAAMRRFVWRKRGRTCSGPFEVGEAALDQVLALVGGEEVIGAALVLVGDEAVASVQALGVGERLGVECELCLRAAVLLGDRQPQERTHAAALEDRARAPLDLGRGAAKVADAAVEAGDLFLGARQLARPLLARGGLVVEREHEQRAQLVRADCVAALAGEVARRRLPVALGCVGERRKRSFVQLRQPPLQRPVLGLRTEEAQIASDEGGDVGGRGLSDSLCRRGLS